MKPSLRFLTRFSILLGSIAALSTPARAASVVWDSDGTANAATGGTGNWDLASPLWFSNGLYAPWDNVTNAADTAVFGGTAGTVTLTAPIMAGGLQFNVGGYTLAGANSLTLANNALINTNSLAAASVNINSVLTGTNLLLNPLVADSTAGTLGQGRVVLGASATNTGTTTISNGVLELNNVTMNTGTGITINGSGLYHPSSQSGTEYPYHRLRLGMVQLDGALDFFGSQMVTLNGGTLLRVSTVGGSDTGTVQNITLNTGDNILAAGPNGGAPSGDTLAITNLTRNSTATVQFRSAYGTLGANGDNGKIAVTNLNGSAIANTNGILGGWAYANDVASGAQGSGFATAFATWDAALGSVRAAVPDKASNATGGTLANQALSAATSTDNWLANGNNANNTITSNVTVNTLIEQSDVIVSNNATLTIGSGGMIFSAANFWLQSADATGKLTSGAADGSLYLNAASTIETLGDLRIRVKVTDNGVTPVTLVKSGNAGVTIGAYNTNASTVNTYSGGTIIQAGRMVTAATDAFGTGPVTVLPGGQALLGFAGTYTNNFVLSGLGAPETAGVLGALRFGINTLTGNITLAGDTRIMAFAAADAGTVNGVVSGAFGFEKAGAGVLILGGASPNTYTGNTLVTGGTLRAGKALAFGPVSGGSVLIRGGVLDTNNQDLGSKIVDIQGTGLGGAGAIVNSGAGVTVGVQKLQLSANASIGGTGRWDVRGTGSTVTLNNFTLTKTGTNLVSLVTATVSPGNLVVAQGSLGLEAGTTVLAAPGSSIQVNPGGSLWVHDFGTAVTLTRDIVLNGGELTSNATGSNGNSTIGSNVSFLAASNINVADAAATMRITGNLSGAGAVSKIGNGVLRVDGTISGVPSLTINAGRLILGAAAGLPSAATTTVASGAVLETQAATLNLPSGSPLIVGRTGAAATDVVGNISAGGGAILNIGGTGSAKTATFANNLTLAGSTLLFDLGSTTTPGGGVSDLVSVGGTLNLSGGNITISINQLGTLANGSYTLFTAGTLVGSAANFNALPAIPNSRQTLSFDTTTVPNSVLLTASGTKNLTWVGGAGNAWDVNATVNWNDGVAADKFFNQDAVNFGETGAGTVALTGTLLPSSTTVNATANYTFAGSGVLSGTGALNKQGTGTLVIANTGANDFTGVTTVSAGVLQVGDGTNGKLGAGAVVNNASLVLQTAEGSTFGNLVSGTGTLTKAGSTTVNLTGANTYTGATLVNGGTLSVATIANGGTASPLGASANTADKLVLSGTLRYTGAAASTDRLFTIGTSGATLDASGTGAWTWSNTGATAYAGTGARTLTLAGTSTAANQINLAIGDEAGGATALVKQGAGTWVLNGANSFTGGVTVNGGVLAADGSQVNNRVTVANLVTVNNTGTFEIRGVNAAATLNVNVNQGGTLRVVSGGSAVSGATGTSHAHLGNVTLSGGTIDLTYFGTGAAYDSESFQLDGNLSVTGTTPSSVTTTQAIAFQGISLNASRTFTVADVTGSPAVDFTVGAEIENRDGGVQGNLVKDGPGTMQLTKQNTFTGGLTIAAGTVLIDTAGAGNILPNNSAVTVQNSGVFDLRGVNSLPTGANAIDVTVNAGGSFRVQSGFSTALTSGNSHNHIRNLTLNGGSVDLFYSGTGPAYDGESFQLNGNVVVGGTTMSTINNSGGATVAQQGISMNGNRTFTVADATAGTDLKVNAELQNSDTTVNDDGFTKLGPGTMELAAANNYNGATIVNEGTLLISGSITGTTNVAVGNGAKLGGSGTITPSGTGAINLSANATLTPGTNGVGQLTIDSSGSSALNLLSFLTDSKLNFDLGPGATSDSVKLVNGATSDIFFSGNILTISGVPQANSYVLFTANIAGAYDGLFVDNGTILAGLFLDSNFTTAYPQASLQEVGNDIVLNVPEPVSSTMLLGGLGLLASLRTRRRRA